jgi:hypothetical protein
VLQVPRVFPSHSLAFLPATFRRARTLSVTAMPPSLEDILWPLTFEQVAFLVDLYKSSSAALPQANFAERACVAINAKFNLAGPSTLSPTRIINVLEGMQLNNFLSAMLGRGPSDSARSSARVSRSEFVLKPVPERCFD